MPQCIYCRQIGGDHFFTREHVIPEAFGKFHYNYTLLREVCGDCNQYFGNKLELALARGSYEAIARIEEGVTPVENVGNLIRNRINLRLANRKNDDGLILGFSTQDEQLGIEPVPQVRFGSKSSGNYIYIPLYELEDPLYKVPSEADHSDLAILAKSEEILCMVIKALADRGVEFVHTYDENLDDRGGSEEWIEGKITVDRIIFRTIAKICYNYLTYIHGAEFALNENFDQVRDLIRRGDSWQDGIVYPTIQPILQYDTTNLRQTNGHLITIDWHPRGRNIIGQVSLFNKITYRIILSRNCNMVWRNIRSGHHFNINSRSIERLGVYRARM